MANLAPWIVLAVYVVSFVDTVNLVGICTALLAHRLVLAGFRLYSIYVLKD